MEFRSKDEKRSAAWIVKEEVDVDMNGSLMRSRKLFWTMLSVVLVRELVENEEERKRARDVGEGRGLRVGLSTVLRPHIETETVVCR